MKTERDGRWVTITFEPGDFPGTNTPIMTSLPFVAASGDRLITNGLTTKFEDISTGVFWKFDNGWSPAG